MKGLFKQKPRSPSELVHHTRELLLYVDRNTETRERKREEKMCELGRSILEMRTVLFGDGQSEPNPDACAHLTREFFKEDMLRLLIMCIPKLETGARQNSTHVIANLQRQRVHSELIASEYMQKNLDLMDILLPGYENGDIALTYGAIARECIRHQCVARYILESDHTKKFFEYIQIPNFEIASDAQATFKELLTRHKSTVAEFLSVNYEWFFQEYNTQLLESTCYITRRHALKLLGNMLLDRSNSSVMIRYVSSLGNMRILMNLFMDSNKTIQLETFHVFKLFVANQNKPPEIISVLVKNQSKLLQFLGDFKLDKEDEQFEADKSQVIEEIANLETNGRSGADSDNCECETDC
ncbi:putative MO25-like protein [Tripterygium wilfordii]|uniref:Putative MO25-like protein n=1 Tax=Tripterygium wilfordii TaxID=458696 RepID=A0A7J7BXZ6_TRIWF|nr:putative MO25-like protein At5g47540 [Tripterygium wilfordii]KAF5726497.1 putative MO25-like protein [Tripterygium wilfordii]